MLKRIFGHIGVILPDAYLNIFGKYNKYIHFSE